MNGIKTDKIQGTYSIASRKTKPDEISEENFVYNNISANILNYMNFIL